MDIQQRKRGIPGFAAAVSTIVLAGVVTVFGMVANTFYQAHRISSINGSGIATKLADQIVDPNVSAAQLEKQGFYPVKYGGFYVDECRQDVLTNSFNASLSTPAKAQKISNCIYERIVETSAGAQRNVRIRNP